MGVGLDGQLPVAGWYADPADPNGERWWSGTEWSQVTRPLETPPPMAPLSAEPAYAGVSSAGVGSSVSMASGVPQFASMADTSWGQAEELSSVATWDAGSTAGFASYGLDAASSNGAVSPGWYSQNNAAMHGPPPTNGLAIAGFVMSLLGFGVISLFISLSGLKKARSIAAQGFAPVGSALAKWGIGLSIWSIVVFFIGVGIGLWFYFVGQVAIQEKAMELGISNQIAVDTGAAPSSVDCILSGPLVEGASVDCYLILADGQTLVIKATMNGPGEDPTIESVS